jgi:diguanylate cyclase (GGDEF)-like protein
MIPQYPPNLSYPKATAERRYDPTTGLPSRQSLLANLSSLLGTPNNERRFGALMLIDIDSFHVTNEVLGHEAGDVLLRRVAVGLRRWADARSILARTGSDEFAVVLTGASGADFLGAAADARASISSRCDPHVPGLSVGVATFDRHRRPTADALLKAASTALREAKQDGGGRIVTYDVDAQFGTDGAEWIARALSEDRLTLFSQPIVDVRSQAITRHELLIRAFDEAGQLLMPQAFLPAAERFGLMPAIDRWVLARGLALASEGLRVSINLSAQSLTDITPLAALVESSVQAGMDPINVMFELTETAAISDLRVGYRALRALSELGCPLALDDFGAGFGCFSYLKHVPAQVVKIDREFIRDISHNPTDRAITTAIVGLAGELGIETIAEGVEDWDTLHTLASVGVRYAQGYLFGRPGPVAPLPRDRPSRGGVET